MGLGARASRIRLNQPPFQANRYFTREKEKLSTVAIARHTGAMVSGADDNTTEPSRGTTERAVWMASVDAAPSGCCSTKDWQDLHLDDDSVGEDAAQPEANEVLEGVEITIGEC